MSFFGPKEKESIENVPRSARAVGSAELDGMGKREGGRSDNRAKYMKRRAVQLEAEKGKVGGKAALGDNPCALIVACPRNLEARCVRECHTLFNDLCDEKYGPYTGEPGADGEAAADAEESAGGDVDGDDDVAAALAAELAGLKDKSLHRFANVKVNQVGVIYLSVQARNVDVMWLANKVMELAEAGELPTRYVTSVRPVLRTCPATLSSVEETCAELMPEHFPTAPDADGLSFGVVFKCTNNSSQEPRRMEYINAIAKTVAVPPNRVDLKTPDVTVLVQIMGTHTAISILPNWVARRRFNCYEINQTAKKAKLAADAAAAEAEKTAEGE